MPFSEKFLRKQLTRFKPLLTGGGLEPARAAQNVVGELMTAAEKTRLKMRLRRFERFEGVWIVPDKTRLPGVMLYLHGGGYTCGGIDYVKGIGSLLAAHCGMRVFGAAYRLAPEQRYPAALEDALAAYAYLLRCGVLPEEIALCGESAGGGLVYCLCMKLKELGMPLPAAIVSISPWTDLTASGKSYQENSAVDPTMTLERLSFFAGLYAENFQDPLVSPLFGDVTGLPPSLLFAGGDEIMLDDARAMHEKLLAAGCKSHLIVGEHMWHAYVLYGTREHRKADFAAIFAFLRENISAGHTLRWMRLDNAAKIFPAARRKHWTNVFRLSASLQEKVDPAALQAALDMTARRFPSIAVRLRSGMFWYYLEELLFPPEVLPDGAQPLKRMGRKEVGRCAFRVLYYENRIAVEIFHALTDGTGGLIFLKTLVAEYLAQRYGVSVSCCEGVLDRQAEPEREELEDSFVRYAGGVCASRKQEKAYRITGKLEPDRFLHVTCGTLEVEQVHEQAKQYDASVTEFLSGVLLWVMLEMQREHVRRGKLRPVVVQIPVNLRRLFESRTLRNFAMVVNAGVDPRMGDYTLSELIDAVRCQMGLEATPQKMRAAFTTNVVSERQMALRIVPLPVKNAVMKMVFDAVGESVGCLSFSNLGIIRVPEEMRAYVTRFDFILSAQSNAPYNCSACSYEGKLRFNVVRNTVEPELERRFFCQLRKMGMHVFIESNQR